MTRKLAGFVAFALAVLLAGGPAVADGRKVPAPIPVPAPVPIPEGFAYYLRGDLGWGFVGSDASFSESGAVYGTPPGVALSSRSIGTEDVFFGGIGAGAYLTPHFRADVTIEFRGEQSIDTTAAYDDGGTPGTVRDKVRLRGTVGLINGYWDLWQRGGWTPYVGAGVGFVYNDIQRTYLATENPGGTVATGSSSDNQFGLAAALMAGITFATDHRFAWDLSYRALYLDGGSITTTLTGTGGTSSVDIGAHWEHQIRIGLRANIW